MELFKRRHLCLLCFFFLIASFCAVKLPIFVLPYGMLGAVLLIGIFLFFCVKLKRHRLPLITVLLCLITVLLALAHSFLWIKLPQKRAAEQVGERAVLCYVVAKDDHSSYSSRYKVQILAVDDQTVNIRGALVCGFDAPLSPGDRVAARVTLRETAEQSAARREGLLLNAYLESGDGAYVQRVDPERGFWKTLFSRSGFRIVSNEIQTRLGQRFAQLLGAEKGALASGFLMGARSEIPTEVTRDFRRSGTSHQMAVSGMHITILLGSIELLLRKLRVGKTARCIAVSFLSVGFLFLTGFSLSACRSVLMLYAVYISYMFHEDHDALTALFVSITVILLVSPYSVNDLGMWMSFLATLGVLTVYALCEKSIPYPKSKKPWKRKILRLGRSILLGALMTVIANLFLLLVVWLIFGELSLVAVMSNLVLTVPAYLFLVGAALLLLFGSVPLLGAVIGWVVSWIASVILSIVSTFSLLPYATVSLNYGFAGIIIVLFSITWAIFLVIRLPKRWLLSLPPVAAVLAFVICLSIYQAVNYAPTLIYSYSRDQELIGVREGNTVSFCDLSSGSGGFSMLYEEMTDAHATEIHTLVLTHYHEEHCSMISLCTKELVLRKLYLPVPEDREEALISKELWEMAVDGGAEVIFYNGNEILQLTDSVRAKVNTVTENSCPATLLSLYSKDCAYTYLSPAIWGGTYEEAARNRMLRSRAVIFGSHGAADAPRYFFDLTESETPEYIVYTSEPILRASGCRTEGAVILAPSETEPYRLRFSFSSSH